MTDTLYETEEHPDSGAWKTEILNDFKQWLSALPDDVSDLEGRVPPPPAEDGDLLQVVGEMIALRQEVRMMSRGTGKLSRSLEQVSDAVATNVVPLADEVRRLDREARVTETRGVLGPLLLELGDLRECVRDASHQMMACPDRPWYLSKRLWKRVGVERQRGLLDVLTKRMDSVLQRQGVKPIAHEAMVFDARSMTAEGVSRSGKVAPGHVSQVVRQGFSLSGVLLRPAIVIVEKMGEAENDNRD